MVSESLDQKHMRPDVSHNSRNQWWCPGFAPTVFATATPAAEVAMCDSTYYIFLILLGSSHFEKPVDRNKQIARFVLSLQLSIVLENWDVLGRGSHVRQDIWIHAPRLGSKALRLVRYIGKKKRKQVIAPSGNSATTR